MEFVVVENDERRGGTNQRIHHLIPHTQLLIISPGRGIEIAFDTGDFFIVTLARPEAIRKESTPQVTPQVNPKALSYVELSDIGLKRDTLTFEQILEARGEGTEPTIYGQSQIQLYCSGDLKIDALVKSPN